LRERELVPATSCDAVTTSASSVTRSSYGDRIRWMPRPTLAPTPIHGEYRKRGDKID
jgi:hypothetical protein